MTFGPQQTPYWNTTPLPVSELADALRLARTKQAEAEASANNLRTLIDNPEMLALAKSLRLNVEAMA